MWEPRRITTLWAFTACYRDSFTFITVMTMKISVIYYVSAEPTVSIFRAVLHSVTFVPFYHTTRHHTTENSMNISVTSPVSTTVRFEVHTDLSIKINIFWDMTPCNPVEIYQRFGETYCLHLHGWRENQANRCWSCMNCPWRKDEEVCNLFVVSCFDPEDGSSKFLRNVGKHLPGST
jgi:hypothetical protein